jgi:hypothetical protein
MRRRAAIIGVVLVLLFGTTALEAVAGSTAPCSTFTGNFAGDQMGDSVRFGAQADFPSSNSAYFGLCVGTADSFSSTWVALGGLQSRDLIQIGLDHCRALACPYPEDGKIHVFWAWGRTHGSEGCATATTVDPIAQDLGVWDGSPHKFKVRKVSSSGVQTYRVYMGSNQLASISASELCWAGSHAIPGFYAESGNFGDATGGTSAQPYRIANAQRQDTLGGSFVNTFFQTPCAQSSYDFRCVVISTTTLDLSSEHL